MTFQTDAIKKLEMVIDYLKHHRPVCNVCRGTGRSGYSTTALGSEFCWKCGGTGYELEEKQP